MKAMQLGGVLNSLERIPTLAVLWRFQSLDQQRFQGFDQCSMVHDQFRLNKPGVARNRPKPEPGEPVSASV
jgi:hypothetical protein